VRASLFLVLSLVVCLILWLAGLDLRPPVKAEKSAEKNSEPSSFFGNHSMTRSSPKSPPLSRKSPTDLFKFDKATSPKSPENHLHGKKSPKEVKPARVVDDDDEFAKMVLFLLFLLCIFLLVVC